MTNNNITTITNSTSVKTSGSSLIGYVTTTYDKLVKAFGEPTYGESGDGKVTTEWTLEFDTGNGKSIVATIYDWRTYDPSICRDGEFEWRVGGFKADALDAVEAALEIGTLI